MPVNAAERNNLTPLRPLNVVMIFLASAVLGGGFLLLSAAESLTLVDGAVEWQAESPLRAVVQLLCLDYRLATINAGDVKSYILGIGAGVALLVLSVAVLAGGVGVDTVEPRPPSEVSRRRHLSPLISARILVVLYVLWSFAGSRWSPSPRISVGGSILLGIGVLWALCLAQGLTPRAAGIAGRVLVVVTGVTALAAIWYYYGRNPTLRAKFPFGNPNFLSASLLPGTLLGISLVVGGGRERAGGAAIALRMTALVCAAFSAWALSLADSRGATVALAAGLGAMVFFMLPGRWRWIPTVLGIAAIAVTAWWVAAAMDAPSTTGRSTTLRFRTYTWSYAWRMFREQPLTGHGQGGFAMLGDSYVGDDVLRDPPVFGSRIDNAHNEGLEILAELGVIGLLLALGVIGLTLRATMRTPGSDPVRADRTLVLGLVGGFVALCVEECVGNGLRVSELPLAFYTVLGLLWASCKSATDAPWSAQVITPKTKPVLAGAGIVLAAAVMVVTQNDFHAARNAYETDGFLAKGEDESAIRLASLAVDRLSPQRVLINLFRLAGTQTIAAERLAARAADRDRRGREADSPNPRLSAMTAEDISATEELCKTASHTLKTLVSASPGFINHGQLEYRINSLLARGAAWRKDTEAATAYMKNAAAALERELVRQPFDPATAAEFVRINEAQLDAETVLTTLARPLRYNRITETFVAAMQELAKREDVRRAIDALLPTEVRTDSDGDPWRAEKLRLAATTAFARGDYAAAVAQLEQAVARYAAVPSEEAIGVAATHAELADGRFYADPEHPDAALAAADDAIAKAPDSRLGRELRGAVRQRMVHYLLAKDDETAARAILREVAPPSVDEPMFEQELGVRYRRLCESLLQRREVQTLRKPVEAMLPSLVRWSRRAIELAPKDPTTHFLAADLAFFQADDDATAQYLRDALQVGLNPADAARFLDVALKKRPANMKLIELRGSLPISDEPSTR